MVASHLTRPNNTVFHLTHGERTGLRKVPMRSQGRVCSLPPLASTGPRRLQAILDYQVASRKLHAL
eukprot:scaffold57717_cov33-Tisochrysis_lutea.AAC.4